MKKIQLASVVMALTLFISCGGTNTTENETTDDATIEATHDHDETESGIAEMISAPEGTRVYFANLEDGAVVTSPVKVIMGSEGIKVQPAGELVEGTGHHHLIINEGPTPFGTVVGADETHIHYGKGQEETELDLEPGEYTLTLQFADGFHRSYGEKVSSTITIEVQ